MSASGGRDRLRTPTSPERATTTEKVAVRDEPRETYQLVVYVDEAQPLEGVDVTIERWDGATTTNTTDREARATFEVYPGEYTISATYAGQTYSEVVTVGDDKTVFLPYHGAPNETAATA